MLSVGTGTTERSTSSDSTEMHQEHCWPTTQLAHPQRYMVCYFLQTHHRQLLQLGIQLQVMMAVNIQ